MFRRRFKWFGKLVSDEGFTLTYQFKGAQYTDERGTFGFPLEDGILIPRPFQVIGEPIALNRAEIDQMVDCILRAIKSEGNSVQVLSE
jgi:hypothetical protein